MALDPNPSSRPRSRTIARAGLVLAGLLAGLALLGGLELGVRRALDVYRCDEHLGWTFDPGDSGFKWSRHGEFLQPVHFNSLGFHDDEHPPHKPDGAYRVLVLGDSISASLQVPPESAFLNRTQRELDDRAQPDRSIELIDAGIDGFGTAQELLLFRERMARFEPDLVLLQMFITNDLTDNSSEAGDWNHYLARRCGRPYFALEDGRLEFRGRSQGASGGGFLDALLLHSQLYANLVSGEPPDGAGPAFRDQEILDVTASPPLQRAWELTQRLLRELAREVESRGMAFAVLIVPDKMATGQFTEEQIEAGLPQNGYDTPHRQLAASLAENGYRYLDLLPALERFRKETGRPAYFTVDSHWNEDGHAVAARALSEWLVGHCRELGLPIEGCATS